MAFGELLLRKSDVEDRRSKAQKESKLLLDNTRKAIARLSHLKRSVSSHVGMGIMQFFIDIKYIYTIARIIWIDR
jgi:hypothetical protein